MTDSQPDRIVLFDGVCNLCNASILFIIQRDPRSHFRFLTLQSSLARELLIKHNIDPNEMHSIILLDGPKAYRRSRAALEISRRLTGLWPLMYAFVIVPPFLRNVVYDWIASNRYKWFGKKDQCMIPTPELKSRFLE